ncbi:hypothetical protein FHG87_012887 [Trinorchestia longiramus]|nr:hypothetical protein FHG87_012887 [Trinorchestia longiramus]
MREDPGSMPATAVSRYPFLLFKNISLPHSLISLKQGLTSSIDKDQVLRETFDKVQTLQQKNVFLSVGEVQIRPTVSISGGLLSGMAENNRNCKATSILITRLQGTVRVKERQYSDDYYTHSICCQPLKFAVNLSEKD